jgi:hypothetical protein
MQFEKIIVFHPVLQLQSFSLLLSTIRLDILQGCFNSLSSTDSIPGFSMEYKPVNFQFAPRVCGSFLCWFIPLTEYSIKAIYNMSWDIEYTDEFGQ